MKTEIYWPTGQVDFKIFFLPCSHRGTYILDPVNNNYDPGTFRTVLTKLKSKILSVILRISVLLSFR